MSASSPRVAAAASPVAASLSSSSSSSPPTFPLLSLVSYNHELLKLRLANIHSDWLFQYKLQTEKPIDDQRKQGTHPHTHTSHPNLLHPRAAALTPRAVLASAAEFIRGHSLHIPGFALSNYPIRRVWSNLLTQHNADEAEDEEEDEQKEPEEGKAWTPRFSSTAVVRHRSDTMLGASCHAFCTEEERRLLREDEAAERRERLTRKRQRQSRWKAEVDSALTALTQPFPLLPSQGSLSTASPVVEDGEEQRGDAPSPAPGRAATGSPLSDGSALQSGRAPSPMSSGRSGAAASGSPSPVPSGGVGTGNSAVPALCEECGCRVDSQWSRCDFCGYDPLEDDDEDEEGGRRRKKKRAQRMANLLAAQQTNEKKQKALEEMRLLAETMSPWESVEAP